MTLGVSVALLVFSWVCGSQVSATKAREEEESNLEAGKK